MEEINSESSRTFYKYLSLGNLSEQILEHTRDFFKDSHLYMGLYKVFNDPMEAIYIPEVYDRKYINLIKDEKSRIKFGCMTTNYTDVLMWSHYANGHRGCCVEFEIKEDCDPTPIIYQPSIFKLEDSNQDEISACKEILSHKLSPWSYEDEARCFKQADSNQETFLNIKIKRVWLGCALKTDDVKRYKEQLVALGISYEKINQLDIHELTFKEGTRRISIFPNR